MRVRDFGFIVTLLAALGFSPVARAQGELPAGVAVNSAAPADQKDDKPFNPRDLSGPWMGYYWHAQVGPGKGPNGYMNFASFDQKIPEPPLTEWAKQHLLYKSISHDALAGTHMPGWDRPGHVCPSTQDPCYSADPYGVVANDFAGEYPAKDCEPLSTPAMYDYPELGQMEFAPTADGSRMYQFFEYHHEWRTFWLNREHLTSEEMDPSFEGDSIAHWEGNTLVVDTIGYNGKTMVSQNVGHSKSDAFRLVERIRLLDRNNLEVALTYYDPKAWGDKSWPAPNKYYYRASLSDAREFICSPREYQAYEKGVIAPEEESLKAIQGK
jgi:hypothetical protein